MSAQIPLAAERIQFQALPLSPQLPASSRARQTLVAAGDD